MKPHAAARRPALRGFTLIELLAVIVIIGILAAILIPTVGRVRQSARETSNLSNLRQLALTFNLYANEHRDRFPVGSTTVNGVYTFWTTSISPYFGSAAKMNTGENQIAASPTALLSATGATVNHYSLHIALCGEPQTSPGAYELARPFPRNQVARPSQVILIADGPQTEAGNNAPAWFYNPSEVSNQTSKPLADLIPYAATNDVDAAAGRGYLRYRNSGSVHAGMVDGSVRAFKAGTVTYANIVAYR